ncbi:MAG: hypothetical protein U1F44_05705 [Coriobacteriia bacterium]|nr:hypothetical protein [Coriobacteriia bacterium]
MGTATTNGFLTWFNTWGSVMYAFMQMLFWGAVAFAAVYAAAAYKRFVDHKIARHVATGVAPAAGVEAEIKIDEFVD